MRTKQWVLLEGAPGVLEAGVQPAQEALKRAAAFPHEVYEHAPGAYALKTLAELRDAQRALQWAIRVIADEALELEAATQRAVAEAAGVAFSTVQRWSREPLVETSEGYYGPGTEPDGRRRK